MAHGKGLTFSKTLVDGFVHSDPNLRYGQAFHQYAKLEKIMGHDKGWCDKLYYAPDNMAKNMVLKKIDYEN